MLNYTLYKKRKLFLKLLGIGFLSVFLINWPIVFLLATNGPGQPGEPGEPGQPGEPSSITITNPLTANTFDQLIYYIAVWLIWIGIPLATLAFLYAGFLFMTSAGEEEKIKRAKKTLMWAVIGLAIILIGTGASNIVKDFLGVRTQ